MEFILPVQEVDPISHSKSFYKYPNLPHSYRFSSDPVQYSRWIKLVNKRRSISIPSVEEGAKVIFPVQRNRKDLSLHIICEQLFLVYFPSLPSRQIICTNYQGNSKLWVPLKKNKTKIQKKTQVIFNNIKYILMVIFKFFLIADKY